MGNSPFPVVPNLSPVRERVSRGLPSSVTELLARTPAGQKGHGGSVVSNGNAQSAPPFNPPSGGGNGPSPPVSVTGVLAVPSYAVMRASANDPNAVPPISTMVLTDPHKPGVFVRASNPAAKDNGGTRIVDSLGNCWEREVENRVNASWFYDAPNPANFFGDNTGVQIAGSDIAANPQWVGMPDGSGMYPSGTTWDYVALQQWIYCCAADASIPGNVVWNSSASKNRQGFCPRGSFKINQQLYCQGSGLDFEFSPRQTSEISWLGNQTGTSNIGPAVLFNSILLSRVSGLCVFDACPVGGCSNWLVSLDGTGSALKTQGNTLSDWYIIGNGAVTTNGGVVVAAGGGGAQGDSEIFINLFVSFCLDGLGIGGDNAVGVLLLGGNFQGCARRGVYNYGGGSYVAIDTICEAVAANFNVYPQYNQISLDGADFYGIEVSSENSMVFNTRSESSVAAVDFSRSLEMTNCTIVPNATLFAGWGPNSHQLLGSLIQVAGNGFTAAMQVDDGGPPWFQSDVASTSTHIINPNNPGWTANQWVGYILWQRFSSNGFSGTHAITSNDANSIVPATATSNGSYLYKICGLTGATAPNWAAVPSNSYGRASRNATNQGFTTSIGSNVVKTNQVIPVGAWMVVCAASYVIQNNADGTTNNVRILGPMIGKVQSVSGGNLYTLVDSYGNPVNASIAITDGMGYWGQPITDGQVTWIPIDWDIAFGVKRAKGCGGWSMGRMSNCLDIELDQQPAGGYTGNFVRNTESPGNSNPFIFKSHPPFALAQKSLTIAGSFTVSVNSNPGSISSGPTLIYTIQGATNPTINFPLLSPALTCDVDIVFLAGSTGNNIITWGTNVLALNPTITLGPAINIPTVVHMKWVGDLNTGGFWFVMGINGPYPNPYSLIASYDSSEPVYD